MSGGTNENQPPSEQTSGNNSPAQTNGDVQGTPQGSNSSSGTHNVGSVSGSGKLTKSSLKHKKSKNKHRHKPV